MSLLGQTIDYPLTEIGNNKTFHQQKASAIDALTRLAESTSKKDSITSSEPVPSNKTVIKTVYDGSKNLNEKRTEKFSGKEEVVAVGKGDFQNILYIDKLTNKVIKVTHIDNMKYLYDVEEGLKANTERVEVNIYYENEKPFYATFKEDHYKNKDELFFSNEYNAQMTSYHKDMYFTNDFQKTIYKYIEDLSDSALKQK